MIADYEKFVRARPAGAFVGRAAELQRISRVIAEGLQGGAAPIAVGGPAGIGKSELLRQVLNRLDDNGAELLPLYFDLLALESLGAAGSRTAEREAWTSLLRSLVVQLVAFDRDLSPLDSPLLGASPQVLTQFAFESGLGAWAPLLRDGAELDDVETAAGAWRRIIRSRMSADGPRPVVVIDGLGAATISPAAMRVGRAAVRSLIAEKCPLVFESSAEEAEGWAEAEDLEFLALGGLEISECLALVESRGRELGEAPPRPSALAVARRMDGHPELLRSWAAAWHKLPVAMNPQRRAWEAYLQVLEHSASSIRWRRSLESALPLDARAGFIRLMLSLSEGANGAGPQALSGEEMIGRSGAGQPRAEAILDELVRRGFLLRVGENYFAPASPALRDWIALQASGDPVLARADLLRRLLTMPHSASGALAASVPIQDVLSGFALQRLPEALFNYEQYHEALGHFPPERRKSEIMQATRTIRMPEVIGVVPAASSSSPRMLAPSRKASSAATQFPIYYAYAYREANYLRSHEETWIAGDCSRVQTLTTTEVDQFLDAARALELRLGPGRYLRWLIAGESVSGEAMERIAKERIFCSCIEQLSIIAESLGAPGASAEKSQAAAREPVASAPRVTVTATTVIPMSEVAHETPNGSGTRLAIRAQNENEVIAALAAERIALRQGFDAEAAAQIRTAVIEGCLNAIEHSGNPEKEIHVAFIEHPASLEIIIDNEGEQFDPLAVADPDPKKKLKARNKRGWGIKLMKGFMDEVAYEPRPNGTRLRLLKRLPGAQKNAEPKPLERIPGRN